MQKRPSAGLSERSQGPNEGSIKHVRSLIGTVLAATALSCGPAQFAQEAPPKGPDVYSKTTERKKPKEPVTAPPPSYGNKVVQVEDESKTDEKASSG